MGLIVEYRQWGEGLYITEVAATVPEMRLTVERWRIESEHVLCLFVRAEGDQFDDLEAAFADLPNSRGTDIVSECQTARLYRVRLDSTLTHLPENSSVNGVISHVRIEPDGIYVTGYLADREELIRTREFITDQDMAMEVVRLQDATEANPDDGLTDEQFEALITAYEMGYFDVPKGATQADVAGALGISPPSLSERLKRAQQRLIEQHLVEGRLMNDPA
ncbi:helix-turn-helix domain-containing protein [Halorientalis brevis]|uniref:Helix-turn-helix domain-containing protein n=1 Tax=Halorientalis brevis TaxID=1126241 RepID=A0ABD6C8W3_9EURY|nr:helix-turn-helix domain-containing protein [Halorientalis brevis]